MVEILGLCSMSEIPAVVVDAQRGFTVLCPVELPVPGGLEIIPQINRLAGRRFSVRRHELVLYGTCAECRSAQRS